MKPRRYHFIGVALVIGLLVSLGGIAFAASVSDTRDNGGKMQRAGGRMPAMADKAGRGGDTFGRFAPGLMGGIFGGLLPNLGTQDKRMLPEGLAKTANMETLAGELVEKGIISSETAGKMKAYFEEKQARMAAEKEKLKDMTKEEIRAYLESKKNDTAALRGRMGAPNILSELVEAGILTQSEADAVTAYQKEQMAQRQGQMQAALTERIRGELSALVSQGIISQEKADAMLAFYTDRQNSVQEEREKLKNMTDEERKAYLDGKKEEIAQNGQEKRAPGTELVEAGILTQDEVDAIVNYYKEQAGAKRQEAIEEKLLALVSDSTITDGQKDAILAALKEGAWMPKAGITDKTQKPAGRMNPLQALVEDGTLTQAQADTVAKALFGMGRGPGRPTGKGLAAKEI